MDEIRKLERSIIVIETHLAVIALIYAFAVLRDKVKFKYYILTLLFILLSILVKSYTSKYITKDKVGLFLLMRMLDIAAVAAFMLIEGYQAPIIFFYTLIIISSAYAMGSKVGYDVLNISSISYIAVFLALHVSKPNTLAQLIMAIFYIMMTAFIAIFSLKILEKYEVKQYELEVANERLRKTVAEFYMLQQVDAAINSIMDMDKLLNTINDVILGVIGPTYSSILLWDDDKNALVVKASNMNADKINNFLIYDSYVLWLYLENQESIIKNQSTNPNLTLSDPSINSFICVSLNIRGKRSGMILVEHERFDALTEDQMRLLKIIADNVGVSLENSKLYEKMHNMAILDGLTKVHNRMYFQEAFEAELAKARGKYPLSIAIGDVDDFKKINDAYGHIAGDKVLKSITAVLKSHLRAGDIIARYGGEEFVILMPHVNMEQAFNIVDRLRQLVERLVIDEEGHKISTTISFGIASYPECGWTTRELLRQADRALYKAKQLGKNIVCLAIDDIQEDKKIDGKDMSL